jgi:exopolysaccharide production protein ExoQ
MKALVVLAAVALALVFLAALLAGGTPLRIGLVFAIVLSPFAVYLTFVRPMLFPYALYILLIPFDNLLNLSGTGTITRFLAMACAPLFILWCLWNRKSSPPPKTLIPLAALLTWILLSATWATNQPDALAVIPTYLGLALLYAALAFTPIKLSEFRILLLAVAASGVIAAVYGAHTYYNMPSVPAEQAMQRLSVQVGTTQIDPNQFANVLLLPAALFIMYLLRTRWLTLKLLALGGLGITIATIMLTESREAMIGLSSIVLYYLWKTRRRLELILIVCAGIGITLLVQSPAAIAARIGDAFTSGGAGRSDIWKVGFEAFKHNWLFGSGIGTFADVYDFYYIRVHQTFGNAGWTRPAHNLLIHYSVEIGIIGLGLLLWFWFSHFSALRLIRRGHPLYDYRVMLEASFIALTIVALFIDLFTYKYAWLVFALMIQLRSIAATQMHSTDAYSVQATPAGKPSAKPLRPITVRSL